jgi:2-dehydro-3-deoxyphosphogluconate aldolase / (4S)-4-hydroxy-2-oxoglutarate aldolase
MSPIETIMRTAPVIPVLVIDDAARAGQVAQALVAGGLRVLEVTLRTPAALEAIREMKNVPGAIVGAGTVIDPDQFEGALSAGAEFIVSPGLFEPLVRGATSKRVPILPGVATASDIMRGLALGLSHFKFFPAVAAGGMPALKALAAPFSQCRFCPTGGITAETAPEWLALEPVLCVGGSWLVPKGAGAAEIEAMARQAAAFAR